MKVHKIFTVDLEIAKELEQVKNASALVNKLLTEHFNYQDNPKTQKQMEILYD